MQYNQQQPIESVKERLSDLAVAEGIDLIFLEGHDDAIIGLGRQFNKNAVIYDKNKIIKNLCKDMSEEEAEEWFEFNIVGSYVGESTPIFLEDV
jgi:ABC-type uncharacterized transport system ATPase subunit